MKKYVVLLLLTIKLQAQDTIRFKNGDVKAVKVSEINSNEVKYHRADYPDGPQYVVYKSDIKFIKYSNGAIDTFNEAKTPQLQPSATQSVVTLQQAVVEIPKSDKIEIGTKKLYYNGYALGETRMQRLIYNCPNSDKQQKVQRAFDEMKSCKKRQYAFGFAGLGAGVGCFVIGMEMAIIGETPEPFLVGILAGTTFGVTGAALSAVHKKKRQDKFIEAARLYNE